MTRLSISTLLGAVCLASVSLLAHVNGAIFTTVADGTTVNANLYASKADVYLNGGPQNENGSMLSPDGLYYFQVTDPSGADLLSTDGIECRMVAVVNGRIAGPAGGNACGHAAGAFNAANGSVPVQLKPFDDTPNAGGLYKAWLTPVDKYGACDASKRSHGFCDAWSKTDNFRVIESAPNSALVTACKFNDFNANRVHDAHEPLIPHWPITANGVDGGTVTSQTDDDGCVTFGVSEFTGANGSQTVVLSEGTFGPDWTQTAPESCGDVPNCSVDNGVITLTVVPANNVVAPSFGSTNPFCQEGCSGGDVIATATASASLVRTFDWTIAKTASETSIKSASSQADAGYTVTVSHDAGTDSDWGVLGSIRVANPGAVAMTGLVLSVESAGGSCEITSAHDGTVAAGSHDDVSYRCTFAAAPGVGAINVTGTWAGGQLTASAPLDFSTAAISAVNGEAAINDSMTGELGVVSASSESPTAFTYTRSISGQPGTCTTTPNVATLTTNTTAATREASQPVTLCVGANLSALPTAAATLDASIAKTVERPVVQQQGTTATLNYTVTVTENSWRVAGAVTVSNPNDWQDVVAAVTVAIPNATCSVTAASVLLTAASSIEVPYSCTFASAPPATVTAAATIAWDAAAASTNASSTQATAAATFAPLTVVDAFNGAPAATLGVVSAPAAVTSIADPRTVDNVLPAACQAVTNVASIAGRDHSASQTAYACNTTTGARTIGFWQNKNGQGIITASSSVAGVCAAGTWLRQFTPFQDLAATASCKTVASYAMALIKTASAAGASMNAMLKAQMLASALDTFFSDATLGGNALGAPVSVGSVRIDLTSRASAFGGATSLTVLQMLALQNAVSNPGGSMWYGNVKTMQELAKTAFDQINNEIAPIAR